MARNFLLFPSRADVVGPPRHVRFVPILLKNSKIEQLKKSRESRSQGISAAASFVSAAAGARDRFWMK